jgi:DNA invertase Pin-like site-specific DNA recombinase
MICFNPAITVGYARVSTIQQVTKGNALERYIEDMLDAGIEVYFTDVESGGSAEREGFNAVLEACRSWAKVIAIPDFTRFQRSVSIWEQVRPELTRLGTEIRDLYTGQPIGFRTAEEIRQSQIKSADAEFIRNYAAEQSLRGFERMRKQKRPFHAAAGLKIVKNELIINCDPYGETGKTYQQVALEYADTFLEKSSLSGAVREFCNRYGYQRIAFREKDFPRNHNSLKLWLENPLLRGHQHYLRRGTEHRKSIFKEVNAEPKIIYNNHEALFSPELAKEIDRALSICLVGQKVSNPKNPLVGLVFCGHCGSTMFSHSTAKMGADGVRKTYDYLYCWGAHPLPGDPKICDRKGGKGLSTNDAINAIIDAITDRAEKIATWGAEGLLTESVELPEVSELRNQISTLQGLNMPDLAPIIQEKQNQLSVMLSRQNNELLDKSGLILQMQAVASRPEFGDR